MKQELYIIEELNTGELHYFTCKWKAEEYSERHYGKVGPIIKIIQDWNNK